MSHEEILHVKLPKGTFKTDSVLKTFNLKKKKKKMKQLNKVQHAKYTKNKNTPEKEICK